MDKVVPLLIGLCSPGIYADRTMWSLSLWPTAPAAESRNEAASSLRASLKNMAVAVGRLLEHKHIGFHTVGEVMPVAHYIVSLPFLQTRF